MCMYVLDCAGLRCSESKTKWGGGGICQENQSAEIYYAAHEPLRPMTNDKQQLQHKHEVIQLHLAAISLQLLPLYFPVKRLE